MRRVVRPEILDTGGASEQQIRESLADLAFINRWFGGLHTSESLLGRILQRIDSKHLTMLDVGGASGDSADQLQHRLRSRGVRLQYTILDRQAAHLNGTGWRVKGDALSLPFCDGAFDVVTCSLLAHHLEPSDIRQFAEEALRVSRVAFLINDLRRSAFHLALVYGGYLFYRSGVTRHDAPVSVRRSYTVAEMRTMLAATSARAVEVYDRYLCRMGAIAWK